MSECVSNHLDQPIGIAMPRWQAVSVPNAMLLEGDYVRLERIDPAAHGDDLYAAYAIDTDLRMWTYLSVGPFNERVAFQQWLQEVAQMNDPYFFTVVDKRTGKALGVLSLLRIDTRHGVAEIGYVIFSPQLQRTRQSTEAYHLVLSYLFDELKYRRCEWKCDSLNHPSRNAAERLGFEHEGTFRQAIVYKGRNRDTAWHSLLDRDWPTHRLAQQRWLASANFDEGGQQIARLSELYASV
ncbi:GNAT family N-acetyltransferase [Thaumasiovibrio subtropicus]|uniref:GNAT family N-acetyltransferase n=1 Tax=Thaumasiovibrio subtropicus TaxID=1891207 RepID=UPI000B35330D|nr:GNAT family protein [Thaumasiovibrio subtropicus]